MITDGDLRIHVTNNDSGAIGITCAEWEGFRLDGLMPALRLDGIDCQADSCKGIGDDALDYHFPMGLHLDLRFSNSDAGVRMSATLRNESGRSLVLNRVTLLGTRENTPNLGLTPDGIRVMELHGNGWGRVIPLSSVGNRDGDATSGEPSGDGAPRGCSSDIVSVMYDGHARKAFLAGFLTSERWLGRIDINVSPDGVASGWRMGFDGGDLLIEAGETLVLEEVLLLAGNEPLDLLDTYGEAVRKRHNPHIASHPVVSWCSWYPYRLGVTEERILENARIAAERLKPLGLSIIEADLGWERGKLPCAFDENDQFPHGLAWLSAKLETLGFDLGVWKAPFTISEFDPLVSEHPEWLIADADGAPVAYWTWFWLPHGNVFILDVTHPGAQAWLRQRIASLHERGVRYFKADFIGCVSHDFAKRRHNPRIVAGGGTEAARIGAAIIREALPDALQLNCGGPEMPGKGHWPLLYACYDTGNTGFLSSTFQRDNHQTLSCHLFKNKRWGMIQPSCLCVGLPGTLEEARMRATASFLAGGQIDISDTLTTLPEDRWDVLTATLPPLGITARPIDLFEPVYGPAKYDYTGTCKAEAQDTETRIEHPPGSVWHVHVDAGWDAWDLVGVFCFDTPHQDEWPSLTRYVIPLSKIRLPENLPLWAYEFWSGQFLGSVPARRRNPSDYAHPGDFQDLTVGDAPTALDIAFFGPSVKLLCLRAGRPHPWVLGSSFHQSCGTELRGVAWDAATRTLTGELHRPAGETGFIALTDAGRPIVSGEVDGQAALLRRGANGSWILPVAVRTEPAKWSVTFGD